jgi:hypothetical protein
MNHQEDLKEWSELTWWEKQNNQPWTAPLQHISVNEGLSLWCDEQ